MDVARRRLYVGGLQEYVDEQILYEAFLPFGEVEKVEIPNDEGRPKGFGFVLFEDEDDAKEAIENMHRAELFGRTLTVTYSKNNAELEYDMIVD